jgi:replicative DNA helicase
MLESTEISPQFDRSPPNDVDAEIALLGAMAITPRGDPLWLEVRALVNRESFYRADNQILFEVFDQIERRGEEVDIVTVRAELMKRGLWEEIGGKDYITEVLGSEYTSSHATHYARIIAEAAVGRSIISLANNVLREVYAPRLGPYTDVARKLERGAAEIVLRGRTQTLLSIGEAAASFYEEREKEAKEESPRRVPTGFSDLDGAFGGLPLGKWILVAGKAGMGKSQLAKQLAINIATLQQVPCGVVSIEEDRRKIAANAIANIGNMNNDHVTWGRWSRDDWRRAADAVGRLQATQIYLDDSTDRLSHIEGCIARMAIEKKCKVIFIDHIHLVDAEIDANRERQVATISRTLKVLAKKLDVALVGLCQQNRGGESDYNRRPILKDLRDSGSLEADGDLILMLYREDYYRHQEPGWSISHRLEVLVRKNKDGPLADVPLYFDGDHQRISDWNGGCGGEAPLLIN